MSALLFMCVAAYGITRIAKYAKNHPAQSMQFMAWLRQMFVK